MENTAYNDWDAASEVYKIDRSFQACTLLNANQISGKEHLFLKEKVVIVGIDVLRAAATACAVLSCGANAIRFCPKDPAALQALEDEQASLKCRGLPCVTIGEFSGRPIAGCLETNSPQNINAELMRSCYAYIISANLGALCTSITQIIEQDRASWKGKLIVSCLPNLVAVAKTIQALNPRRIVICCSGRSGMETLEDTWLAGRLLHKLKISEMRCDDGSRIAMAVADRYNSTSSLLKSLLHGRAYRILRKFSKEKDFFASLVGKNVDPKIYLSMTQTVPQLQWNQNGFWFVR